MPHPNSNRMVDKGRVNNTSNSGNRKYKHAFNHYGRVQMLTKTKENKGNLLLYHGISHINFTEKLRMAHWIVRLRLTYIGLIKTGNFCKLPMFKAEFFLVLVVKYVVPYFTSSVTGIVDWIYLQVYCILLNETSHIIILFLVFNRQQETIGSSNSLKLNNRQSIT